MEENMTIRESDIDLATVLGYGFPPYWGGIMYWARNIVGWKEIVSTLDSWKTKHKLKIFTPSKWARNQV